MLVIDMMIRELQDKLRQMIGYMREYLKRDDRSGAYRYQRACDDTRRQIELLFDLKKRLREHAKKQMLLADVIIHDMREL